MLGILGKAAMLGLSTGMYCLGYCLPVIFPMIFSEEHSQIKARTKLVVEFSTGRLIAYLIFGGTVGYLGQRFPNPILNKLIACSIIVLSLLLILYGLVMGFPQLKTCVSIDKIFPVKRFPILMGLFVGFNICPPFLLAVSYVFTLGEVIRGIIFFFIFFIATSLYLIPFIFIGYFSKFEKMRWIAQLSAILSGGLFFLVGISQIFAH
jgi:sulfite exporter TauE/SafE